MSAPEMSESVIKAVSALGVDSLRQSALRQVGSQLLIQRAKYQAALTVACKGGAPIVQREATIKASPGLPPTCRHDVGISAAKLVHRQQNPTERVVVCGI